MACERVFLGWDRAVLPAAAAWLIDRLGPEMGGVLVAVPTARAGRRLVELLADRLEGPWVPPEVVTVGTLPERLYDADPGMADELGSVLARARALRSADPAVLGEVVPHPPAETDVVGWVRLAEQLAAVRRELAAGGLAPDEVVGRCAAAGVDLGLSEARWRALGRLEAGYLDTLGRPDRDRARQRAAAERRCGFDGPVVLVGLVDLSPQVSAILAQVSPLTALVPAPRDHAAGFDALGGLIDGYWREQAVAVDDLRLVDRPEDQGAALVRVLAALPAGTPAEAVSVGMGDETQAGPLRRAIESAGVPARPAAGRPLSRSAPAVLLETLGRYAAGRRLADLATLVRHPLMAPVLGADEPWLSRLDAYATRYLQTQVPAMAPDEPATGHGVGWGEIRGKVRGEAGERAFLGALQQRVDALLPADAGRVRPWPQWIEPMAEVLRRVLGDRPLDPEQDHALIDAVGQLAAVFDAVGGLDAAAVTTPSVTFAQAVSLCAGRWAGGRVPERGGTPAVELMGFLDVAWDDAAHVVLTDVNEGSLPESRGGDAFLPDGLRRTLGLPDDAQRLGRDVLLMNIVLRSRAGRGVEPRSDGLGKAAPDLTAPESAVTEETTPGDMSFAESDSGGATSGVVLACRRSAEGDPRAPSRLLLAGDDALRVARVKAFYAADGEGSGAPARSTTPAAAVAGGENRFLIPRPLLDGPAIDRLRVTAFRDYLACPYRFYLKHVLKLGSLDDRAVEMDALAYGSLAHEVLEAFGRSDAADATEPGVIETFLSDTLSTAGRSKFGGRPRPAVRVQVEQLRERLAVFADRQAAVARQGWRIRRDLLEKDLEASVSVDGQAFTVTGRIDRVDEHPELGVRLLDYKTSDAGDDPGRTHVRGGRWVDLQLPLYRTLVGPRELGRAAVGYFNLPKSPDHAGVRLADWDDAAWAEARAARDGVVRGVRGGVFWPPVRDVPRYPHGLSRIAAEGAMGRDELIGASWPGAAGGGA
ncbi:MAG: PD-(D/E)XK nuclease family protein [Planctomycetota bacterium]